MNKRQAIEALCEIHSGDPEAAHTRADAILCEYLRKNGAPSLAIAFETLRDRVGFYYA